MSLFTHEVLSEHIIRIIDCTKTAAYLVIGTKKACLIDTCNGFGNLKEYVESITYLPYRVVLTHGHFDHAGAASLFDEIYLHPKDEQVYHDYFEHPLKMQVLKTLPSEFVQSMNPEKTTLFCPLSDHHVFELGDVNVEMLEVKGHTQGMMMAWIEKENAMIFGDACGESVLIFDDYSTTISEYRESLLRIQNEYGSKIQKVYRNHGTFESEPSILEEVIQCCDEILQKKDDHFPVKAAGTLECFAARRVDEKNHRVDGLHGNVVYRIDKVK